MLVSSVYHVYLIHTTSGSLYISSLFQVLTTMAWLVCPEVMKNMSGINNSLSNVTKASSLQDFDGTIHINSSNLNDEATLALASNNITYGFFILQIVIPIVCSFGLLGNLLALVVLICRINEGIDVLEKGSIVGMMGNYLLCSS